MGLTVLGDSLTVGEGMRCLERCCSTLGRRSPLLELADSSSDEE